MKKHPSEIIRQVLLRLDYLENADGTFSHPYEIVLENSPVERLRRKQRLAGRLKR